MKRVATAVLLLALLTLSACGDDHAPAAKTVEPAPTVTTGVREVTLRSHLYGPIDGDPLLRPGERVRFVPAPNESIDPADSVLVDLPGSTGYEGRSEQLFLRGYAIGFAAWVKVHPG